MEQPFADKTREEVYAKLCAAIDLIPSGDALHRRTARIVQLLLSSEQDESYRAKTLTQIDNFFKLMGANPGAQPTLRDFAKKLIHMLLARVVVEPNAVAEAETEAEAEAEAEAKAPDEVECDDDGLPLDRPTDVVVVPAPQPKDRCDDFRELLAEAIWMRVSAVITFFQRHNPRLDRQPLRLFIFSPDFGARFEQVIRKAIIPAMMKSRPVNVFGEKRTWSTVAPSEFWTLLSRDEDNLFRAVWLNSWTTAIEQATASPRQQAAKSAGGDSRKTTGKTSTKNLGKWLASHPDDQIPYLLPPLSGDLASLFASLLYDLERNTLEVQWTPLRQLYEQELDRRIYQDRARYGAFRDRLLEILERLPPRLGELMAVLCYYNFRRMSLTFLRDFVRNKGVNQFEWRDSMPLLMFFLDQPDIDEIESAERAAEERRLEIAEERRRQRIAEEAAAMPDNAVLWRR